MERGLRENEKQSKQSQRAVTLSDIDMYGGKEGMRERKRKGEKVRGRVRYELM